jgi:hypothetical protein
MWGVRVEPAPPTYTGPYSSRGFFSALVANKSNWQICISASFLLFDVV